MTKRFIKIECPECDRVVTRIREDYDPPEAALLVVACPNCSTEGGMPYYYDAAGNELGQSHYDPTEPDFNRDEFQGE